MGENSKIEWTHHTFNPWEGCEKISPGCANCYAEALSKRFGSHWGPNPRKFRSEAYWHKPLKWNADALRAGERHRVFCASMADVFEDRDELVEHRERLFRLIDLTPSLDWLLLSKRPENMPHMVPDNVWLGTSTERQQEFNLRVPPLLDRDAVVSFLSCEPLLEPISLGSVWGGFEPDWVIVGGESGPRARPMNRKWVRSLRDQCDARDIPFFFKQWGEYDENGNKVGKKAAGRILDGRTWDELPVGLV